MASNVGKGRKKHATSTQSGCKLARHRVSSGNMGALSLYPPLRLTAFEFRKRLEGGLSRPPLVVAVADDGAEYRVVLKVRHPDNRSMPHFGGTSLACELVCAVLARAIGLQVPDYAIVDVPRHFAESIPDTGIQRLLCANAGANFGSIYLQASGEWRPTDRVDQTDMLDSLEDVLAFDAAVINGDRKARKPNLLQRGRTFYLIDHSLAVPVHTGEAPPDFLFPEEEVRQHCVHDALFNRGKPFCKLFRHWITTIPEQDWVTLRSWIPADWEERGDEVERVLGFLQRRAKHLEIIANDLRRVVR